MALLRSCIHSALLALIGLGYLLFSAIGVQAFSYNNFCGDGAVEEGEECDDGNYIAGDGCDANCHIEEETSTECVGTACQSDTTEIGSYHLKMIDLLTQYTPMCSLENGVFDSAPFTEQVSFAQLKAMNLLKAGCFVEGYNRKGRSSFQGNVPLGIGEAIKIVAQLHAQQNSRSVMEHGSATPKLPYTDVQSNSWYTPYASYAYDVGLLQGRNGSQLKAFTPIYRMQLNGLLGTPQEHHSAGEAGIVTRAEFAEMVYESFKQELDQYRFINGNNALVLARLQEVIMEQSTTKQLATLRKIRDGLQALDADMMMRTYVIDTNTLVEFINMLIAD